MRVIFAIVLSIILLVGGSCTGSKSYSKKAKKLQEAGLNDEAAAFYLQALQRNPKNVDAKIGLRTTGQVQIERTLTAFYKAYSVANYKEAVYKYQEALTYKRKYGYFVTMEIPPYYQEYYQEMLDVYLDERYEDAGDLLYQEKFNEANIIYREIIKLDPEFKDVKELSLQSLLEPMYRNGVAAFDNEKYKKCYSIMAEILSKKPHYKDAIDYKDRSLEEGQVTIAVLEFQSVLKGRESIIQAIQGDVVSGIIKINDPFIKVLDRSNVEMLIKEQKINVAEASSGNSAIRTGELLGADLLIRGKLLSYNYSRGTIKGQSKQGFESYQVKKVDAETKKTYYQTYYKRVNYTEFEGSSSLSAEVQYQLVSAETGEVVKAEVLRDMNSDYVNYVDYRGNYKKLYSGKYSGSGANFKSGDVIYSSRSQQRALQNKVRSNKRTLKTEPELTQTVLKTISNGIIRGVAYFDIDEL